jgi:hypothetical protein
LDPSYVMNFETDAGGVAYISIGDSELNEGLFLLLKSPNGAPVDFKVAAPAGEYNNSIDLVDRNAHDAPVAGTTFTYMLN